MLVQRIVINKRNFYLNLLWPCLAFNKFAVGIKINRYKKTVTGI